MKHNAMLAPALLLLSMMAAGLIVPQTVSAAAVSCSAGVTVINFGGIDPTVATSYNTKASFDVTCTNKGSMSQWVVVCASMANGPYGLTGNKRRLKRSSGAFLPFQFYRGPSHRTIWGGGNSRWPGQPLVVGPFELPSGERVTLSVEAYAHLSGPLRQAEPGSYTANFRGRITGITYLAKPAGRPTSCANTEFAENFRLKATAHVRKACHVTATDMDFGTVKGWLDSNVDATSRLAITCSNGMSYHVGLSRGRHYAGGYRRMSDGHGHYIKYRLYRDADRTHVWGPIGENAVIATGSGHTQYLTVYGRVPPQKPVRAGIYRDIVQIWLSY